MRCGMENRVYTVSQVNQYIKSIFVRDYALNHIYIKGEVSNCKYHTSGHIYFTLKDSKSQMPCVMFAGKRAGLAFRLSEGQSVVVLGNIGVYERDGRYQLYADEIIPDGIGILYQRFEELKRELEEEGLFSDIYKKPIPAYCGRIGIVTAPTGAAIQDMIHISHRRNPYAQLILYPALVQGQGAKESIVRGIRVLDSMNCDVMIVGRGGGSLEDLWAFNEEAVVRAVFECTTPVISAVGHETDTTLSDFAADLRAPTPSAAAELANVDIRSLLYTWEEYRLRLSRQMEIRLEQNRKQLSMLSIQLQHVSPQYQIQQKKQFLVDAQEELQRSLTGKLQDRKRSLEGVSQKLQYSLMEKIQRRRHRLEVLSGRLHAKMPLERLRGGYAYVTVKKKPLISVQQVKREHQLRIVLRDGELKAEVTEIMEGEIYGEGSKNTGTVHEGTADGD